MDYEDINIEWIEKKREEFAENPTENIKRFIEEEDRKSKEAVKNVIGNVAGLLNFKIAHAEYAELFKVLMVRCNWDLASFIDEVELIRLLQMANECKEVMVEYQEGITPSIGRKLAKAYASSLESMWNKLKKIICLLGLSPKGRHLTITDLKQKIEKIEKANKLKLPFIKSVIDAKLRNPINHENIMFVKPNIIIFYDTRSGTAVEVEKLTTEEIYSDLVKITIMDMAFHVVENSAMSARLKPLLKLDEEELKEYIKTGKLTPEMQKKIDS